MDTRLEITEFADRSVKTGGPALLFEKPRLADGTISRIPVLINSFASMRRMEIALEVDSVDEVAKRISEYLEMRMPEGLLGKLKMLPKLAEMGAFFPKIVAKGPARKSSKPTASRSTITPCSPAGPAMAAPSSRCRWFSRAIPKPASATAACTGCRFSMSAPPACTGRPTSREPSTTAAIVAEGKSTRMEVAVAIGSDPATMYSAILPLPPDLDEMMIAGFLRGSPVEMVKCQTVDLEVPANSELVLEGYVELGELRTEGPFGDHTGYYSLADQYPVFHVTCVTERRDPIYATTIVGPPPMEDFYMGKAIERIFLPLMRMQIPEVRDMCMPAEGVFHNLMLISIRKSYPGHARKVMSAIWGLGQAMFTKVIVVVDEDVDVQNVSEVAWRALNNIDPERDVQFTMGPIDSLDHASRLVNYGSKMGIDATRKWPGEGFTREWPEVLKMPDDVKARVSELWKKANLK